MYCTCTCTCQQSDMYSHVNTCTKYNVHYVFYMYKIDIIDKLSTVLVNIFTNKYNYSRNQPIP